VAESPRNDLFSDAQRFLEEGQPDDALALLREAAQLQPANAEVFHLAGTCLLQLSDFEAALDAFQRAMSVRRDWPAPYLGAARALAGRGDAYGSMQALLHVLDFAPEETEAVRQLQELLTRLRPDRHLPALEPALLACFDHPDIDPQPLAALCAQQLRLSVEGQKSGNDATDTMALITRIANSQLWLLYLTRVINTDRQLERLLTRIRRHLCLTSDIDAGRTGLAKVFDALARQCFLNEYVFDTTQEEADKVATLDAVLDEAQEATDSAVLAFALACLYRPPATDSRTRTLAQTLVARSQWLSDLCRLAVFEPHEESQIAETLPALHPVHHQSSLPVQAQYESNPYPRWRAPPAPAQADFPGYVRKRFSRRPGEQSSHAEPAQVLVAGCGTGFEPIDIARRDSSVQITAIDLSRSSLAYAKRQADALRCDNIEFLQGDILDLPGTDGQFDIIVCTGVLHHMADPLEGWEILRALLADDGLMRIGLYSAIARRSIARARSVIEQQALSSDKGDIRRFRKWLLDGSGDPELDDLRLSDDFYSMSGCRDLLFHAREHQFTLPQVSDALAKLDLRFCGFDAPNAALTKAFSARHPDSDTLLDLDAWDRFERANPTAFADMYQFWCEPEPG
jgi:SAM-dependent methyltransferase/tetratricopeptide (TPR) repeat protein